MPGGKENAPPPGDAAAAAAAAGGDKDDKKEKKGHDAHGDDGIGPGDEKKGIAEVGWHLPCACTVLGGIPSACAPTAPRNRCLAPGGKPTGPSGTAVTQSLPTPRRS
jgi:hypothetical protein|eukprot:COSAG06_NODE_3839_length_4850_cov_1.534203_8_plen_107_part_00